MSHDSECKVGNPTHIPRRDSLRGAKLQKNIDVGKFWGEKLSRKLILQGERIKTPHNIQSNGGKAEYHSRQYDMRAILNNVKMTKISGKSME